MKKILLSISLLILPILANCQGKKIYVKNFEEVNIPNWVSWKFEYSKEIELKDVHENDNQFHFRFSTDEQIIEIYLEEKGKSFKGQIINWTTEYVDSKEESTNRIFFTKEVLDSIKIERIIQLINNSKVEEIPDDESIKNWQKGFDGVTYSIEFSNKKQYSYKSYWTPTIQETVEEAKRIQKFVTEILEITEAENSWNNFRKQIPYECYINSGPDITCKVLNWFEKRKFKKERKNYRQQSINSVKLSEKDGP